jgi:hypothetical protein
MAEEIKEDGAIEEEPLEETGDKPASGGEKQKKKGKPRAKKKSGMKKWFFLLFVLLLAGSAAAAYFLFPDKIPFLSKKNIQSQDISINEDELKEESLEPFFIPPGPSASAIRIDLTAAWDVLASIRYKKEEVSTRNLMYNKLYEMAGQNSDLNSNIPLLENEVSLMLRESLGVQNLVIRIKEIRYF